MLFTSLVHHYLFWHYTQAIAHLWHITKNIFWFLWHFFSVPQLLASLFAPWRRMTEAKQERFSFEALASYIIINIFSRLIGALIRGVVLICGAITFILYSITAVCVYTFWIFAPALLLLASVYGIVLII